MTCVPSDPRFRLLDWRSGWDAETAIQLVGLDDDGGVRLDGGPSGIGSDAIDPYIPPPRLAPGCDPCEWFLATKAAPTSRIMRLDGCSNDWAAWPGKCAPVTLENAAALTVDRHLLAVADAGATRVWIFHLPGAQIAAEVSVADPVDLSFDGRGLLVVLANGGADLQCFTGNGRSAGNWPGPLPQGSARRIAHDRDGRLWIVTDAPYGGFALWAQSASSDPAFHPKSIEDLAAAFARTDATNSNHRGFCIKRGAEDLSKTLLCWTWFGRRTEADCITDSLSAAFATQGQLLTHALDSGVPRCIWHRLRIDADVPPNTRLEIAVTTDDQPLPPLQPGPNPAPWNAFPVGRPNPQDWVIVADGITDALIDAPAGRYLFVRMRLSGDGSDTPRVRRIHIDFPRATSASLLPAVYHEEEGAQNFTERFIALFDASIETVDDTVARFPALLNSDRTHSDVLPWVASLLSVALDDSWSSQTRRRILAAAPALFRQRGTRAGLAASIQLAFNLSDDPLIIEHGLLRDWGALATEGSALPNDARLGAVRLFSRPAARTTLGRSKIGQAPIKSYEMPDADPHAVGAFRFSVALPSNARGDLDALQRLVDGQKPAHTVAALRIAGDQGFRLGGTTALGIDTAFTRPAPKALGDPALRLSQGAVLGGVRPPAPVTGLTAIVGAGPRPFENRPTCISEGTT